MINVSQRFIMMHTSAARRSLVNMMEMRYQLTISSTPFKPILCVHRRDVMETGTKIIEKSVGISTCVVLRCDA